MPCWVAPVIAAELWGVSLNQLLGAIADGVVPSRQEYGFTVVDAARGCATYPPPRRPGQPAPRTYVLVSEEAAPAPQVPQRTDVDPGGDCGELPPLDEEEDDKPISHWRDVRSRVGRTRRPPQLPPPRAA
jgi:hypothetical protein